MRKLSRKEAEEKMEAIFSALHYNLMDAMNAGGERTGEESYFHAEAWKVDQGRQKEDYRQTVMSLDSVGFKEYYKLVGQFATAYKIGCWKEYSECEPILIEELGEELGRREKTKEKLELINSFRLEELHSQTFSFDAKIKALQDILDDFRVGNEKEEVINRLLASFSGKDSGAFIARLQSDRKLLNGLLGRVNGGEKDWMLALLGEIFASAGLTAEEKAVSLENKASDTLKATFEQGQVFIDVNSPVPGGMRDYTKAKAKSIMVSPFEIIRMNYDGREIKIPALLLLKSWTNSGATPEGLFHNYYKEDLDWNSLGEEERDAYFAEFVAHYLPRGFIEALVSPLQLVITGLITVGLAVTTGGASVIAQLELALSVAGIALTAASTVGSLQGMMAANKMKEAAGTTHEAKKAAKVMAESMAQLSLSVVDLLLTGKDLLKVRNKNVAKSTSEVYLEKLNEKSINKLKNRKDSDSIIRKYKEYFGDNVEFVNELIENTPGKVIYVEPEKLILNYLSKNKINVDSINIKQIINKNTNFNKLKKTIDLINSNVKDIDPSLLKSVPLDTPVNKQTAYMKELNAILEKKGMTLERYKEIVLRNIDDMTNLPPEGSEELKQLAETIRSIREEAVGKLDKDVEFRKFITQEDLIKYLYGEYNTVGGYISRDCDSSVLKEYNEIFNTARLDYPNTAYKPNEDKFIAYIKFKVSKSSQIKKIEIPYSELFSGSSKDLPPVSGSGILNSKNGVLIPEFKAVERLEIMDGAELHIISRDNNNTDKLIGIFSGDDQKFIIKGEQ